MCMEFMLILLVRIVKQKKNSSFGIYSWNVLTACCGFLKNGGGKISFAVSIHVHIQCFVKIKKRIIFHAQLAIKCVQGYTGYMALNLVSFSALRVSMCPRQGMRWLTRSFWFLLRWRRGRLYMSKSPIWHPVSPMKNGTPPLIWKLTRCIPVWASETSSTEW